MAFSTGDAAHKTPRWAGTVSEVSSPAKEVAQGAMVKTWNIPWTYIYIYVYIYICMGKSMGQIYIYIYMYVHENTNNENTNATRNNQYYKYPTQYDFMRPLIPHGKPQKTAAKGRLAHPIDHTSGDIVDGWNQETLGAIFYQ